MNHLAIEQSILRTIIFFDLLEYPLTPLAIWKNLFFSDSPTALTLSDYMKCLRESPFLSQHIEEKSGYYFLKGRDSIVALRLERAVITDHKYRVARRMIALFARVPFVRMVCVCNPSLGLNAAREGSDIDLFIVASARHLWFVRLLCTGLAQVFGIRPHKDRLRDTFCLSFYVGDDALDLSGLQLPGWVPDMYWVYWIPLCVPIYDDSTYDNFFNANEWVRQFLPHISSYNTIPRRRVVLSGASRMGKRCAEKIVSVGGTFVERSARAFQLCIMPLVIREKMNEGTGVVVTDSVLKFHVADRRGDIQEQFLKKCAEYNM